MFYRQILLFSFVAVLATTSTLRAQSKQEDSTQDESWGRFETEFNKFLTRAIDGFRSPEDFNAQVDSFKVSMENERSLSDDRPSRRNWAWYDRDGRDASKYARHGIPRNVSWLDERTKVPDGIFRYNRVEGLYLGVGSEKRYYWDEGRPLATYGSVGYAFKVHRWWGDLGLARQFSLGESPGQIFEVGIEAFDDPASKDVWLIGSMENSLAAVLMREDFRDLYERRGGSVHTAYYLRGDDLFAEGSIAYNVERQSTLESRVSWSIFGGDKWFRPNPAIDDGILHSITLRGGFSTTVDAPIVHEGSEVQATAEFAGRGLGGDFSYEQYVFDARKRVELGWYDHVGLRLRVGSAHGFLPFQRSFALGGYGTMPGFAFKEFTGTDLRANRMILVNAEYIVNGGALNDLSFWPRFIFKHVNLFLFTDAGLVREVDSDLSPLSGFGGMKLNEFRSDFGLGLCSTSGNFRIGAAWRTDRAEPARLYLRISSPF